MIWTLTRSDLDLALDPFHGAPLRLAGALLHYTFRPRVEPSPSTRVRSHMCSNAIGLRWASRPARPSQARGGPRIRQDPAGKRKNSSPTSGAESPCTVWRGIYNTTREYFHAGTRRAPRPQGPPPPKRGGGGATGGEGRHRDLRTGSPNPESIANPYAYMPTATCA